MLKDFIGNKEVSELLGVSQSQAYKIIRELNSELNKKDFLTVRGRVSSRYVLERYGIERTGGDE